MRVIVVSSCNCLYYCTMNSAIPFSRIKHLCQEAGIEIMATAPLPAKLLTQGLELMYEDGVGEMEFLIRNKELLIDPAAMMSSAKGMLIVCFPYQDQLAENPQLIKRARYAAGKDYHKLLRRKLSRIGQELKDEAGAAFPGRACVDSAPVMERTLARLAGLGWRGGNGLLINQEIGSYFFLGVLFTEAELEVSPGKEAISYCGSCGRCQGACPTGALQNGRVVSEKCISYLTIEFSGVIPRELASEFNGWWYGCDICQQVCPWNKNAPGAADQRLAGNDEADQLLKLDEQSFPEYFAGRAIKRISYPMFRRNLLVAFWSIGDIQTCRGILAEGLPLVVAQGAELVI